jgi:hypothetical protein
MSSYGLGGRVKGRKDTEPIPNERDERGNPIGISTFNGCGLPAPEVEPEVVPAEGDEVDQ